MNSSLITPRRIIIAVAVIALLLLIRQCFKKTDPGTGEADQVSTWYDAAATNLNPYLTVKGADLYTCARIYQSFGDLDPKSLELQPMIIEKIPVVRTVESGPHAGQLAYDFNILPEAVWDNGSAITGNDFAFTLKLIYHPLLPTKAFGSYFKDLSGIEVDPANPRKFTIYLKQYYILALESMCQIPIMPAYHYDPSNRMGNIPIADFLDSTKLEAMKTDPGLKAYAEEFQLPKFTNDPTFIVGSGPYKMETMNDQGVILVKKKNWWGDKVAERYPLLTAYPKKLVYKVVKDENVVENMLKNGELDIVAGSISAAKFLEMQQKDSIASRYNFEVLPSLGYNRWLLNLSLPNLQDVRVRKALAHIVDYDHLIKNIRLNLAIRTVGPILPSKRYYAKDLVMYDFNIEKAKVLLANAGWKDSNGDGILDKVVNGQNTKFVLDLLVPTNRTNQQYAESLTETARLAGIEIKMVTTDIGQITQMTRSGDYQSALLGAALSPGLSELSQRYHSKYLAPAGDNRSRYINPTLDELLGRIASEQDDTKRDLLYLEAQKILYDDLPEIFLFAPKQPIITAKKFEGVITASKPGYHEHRFKLKKNN
jgi:peptide/nickel transport system substrate-binding protein